MNLYTKLKVITDSYISFLHTLEGYSLDSCHGFDLYLKEIKAIKLSRSHDPNFDLDTHNRAAQLWGKGPPDDPDTLITHVTSYGEIQKRLKRGGLNESLVGQLCLIMAYEYWEISVRKGLAKELKIKRDELKSDIFGDLRLIRNDIIHNRSVSSKGYSQKCLILNRFKEGEQIVITSVIFDVICGEIFDYLNKLILNHTGEIGYSDKSLSLEGKKMMSQWVKTHGKKL